MIWIRSLLFNIFFYLWLIVLLLVAWLFLPFPRQALQRILRWWSWVTHFGLRVIGGVRAEFIGFDQLPKGAALIVSKHQSIWETFIFYLLLDDPQYVLKQELIDLPLWGLYATKADHIAVDRGAGAKALRAMSAGTADRLAKGRQVIIFPEGTRTQPGSKLPYHPGVAALYKALPPDVPVCPVALNSGVHWGRRKFLIKPGVITLRMLEPIQPGLDRRDFMARLEAAIETESQHLLDAGR